MKFFGPFTVTLRLGGEPEESEEEIGQKIAGVLAEHFDVPIHDPGQRQGPKPKPGVTVRRPERA